MKFHNSFGFSLVSFYSVKSKNIHFYAFFIFLKMYSKTQFYKIILYFLIPFMHLKSYLELHSPKVIRLLLDRI